MKLTEINITQKYSKDYLELLRSNLWIQSYRKTAHEWDEEVDDLWIPSFTYLWKLCEAHIPANPDENIRITEQLNRKILLYKKDESYFVSFNEKEFAGSCPEEALLNLFIFLHNFPK